VCHKKLSYAEITARERATKDGEGTDKVITLTVARQLLPRRNNMKGGGTTATLKSR